MEYKLTAKAMKSEFITAVDEVGEDKTRHKRTVLFASDVEHSKQTPGVQVTLEVLEGIPYPSYDSATVVLVSFGSAESTPISASTTPSVTLPE